MRLFALFQVFCLRQSMRNEHEKRLVCPKECGSEAAWAGELEIIAPGDLLQLINHIKGSQLLGQPQTSLANDNVMNIPDLSHVKGQETAKRALEVAAAGAHNMLMVGAPGSGKSMLASCLPGILPPLSPKEALELSMVHSLAGMLPDGGLIRQRPFRSPHHSASQPALIGGGQKVKPGEISLAHHGVLFLDELPEFSRPSLEALRQPMETGDALVARANAHIRYPARFQLIGAMNPCRCGYLGDPDMECTQAPRCGVSYQSKISGPMMDRIDIHVDVLPVNISDLQGVGVGERSDIVAARVQKARDIQNERYERLGLKGGVFVNAHAQGEVLDAVTRMDDETQDFLTKAVESAKLSARGYYRILRVARTISDLNGGADQLSKSDIAEALSYRRIAV